MEIGVKREEKQEKGESFPLSGSTLVHKCTK